MKKLKRYLTAPKRRIKLYLDSASKLGYTGFKKLRIALDISWWRNVHKYKPNDYVFYEFDKHPSAYRKLFLRDYDQYITYGKFNGVFIGGKGGQYELFGKEIVGREWINIDKVSTKEINDFIKANEKVVFKPSIGSCGRGIFAVSAEDGDEAIAQAILSVIGKDYVCEQYIIQHPKLAELNPQSVNAIRILALNDHGTVNILAATLKIGAKDSIVDNLRNNGFAANIDVESGIVNTPCSNFEGKTSRFTESNIDILGFEIPNWDKVCDLARKTVLACKGNILLGLDIAVTTDNAVLIEANNRPGTRIVQSFDKKPKGKLIREYCKKYKKELKHIPRRIKRKHKYVY